MTNHPNIRRGLLAGIVAAACLAAPAAANADSLVFIKNHNVWLAKPDGSGQYQVTRDGTAANSYISPSQANDGTIVAGREGPNGGPLYRMRQNGAVINKIPVGSVLAGPFSPHVSPSGKFVAFEHVFSQNVNDYLESSSDVRFTRADGSTPNGIGETGRGAGDPAWIDGDTAFVGINATATTQDMGAPAVDWWSDYDHQSYFSNGEDLEDGEYAHGRVVVVRGEHDDNTIQFYRHEGGFTTPPTPYCTWSEPDDGPLGRQLKDPTLSPDGNRMAWQEGTGIKVMSTGPGDLCDTAAMNPTLVIPGGSDPDWGPADVNPGPRSKPAKKKARALKKCKRLRSKAARKRCVRKVNRRFR